MNKLFALNIRMNSLEKIFENANRNFMEFLRQWRSAKAIYFH
ncbi:hypothetical protein LEP1GSC059_0862 [Leptospira noguchii serovar Panama str. CZ214]|uniref:Uncharacterized protein n=1 Tax=Leptospira noguchii serovar Panama str. CZ214 TaxID=1001595 RepID=T0FP85_9LEPT|nr:hypothetical protein LEP1GSC059_0862 [Leptospira noguchii serovar Panama str. CZ214]